MYGVPDDLPLSGSTRDESTEVEHSYNVQCFLTKQFVYVIIQTVAVVWPRETSGLLFIMCGYCY